MENETKIASLIELIKEDKIEIRELKKRIYLSILFFIVVSLAITTFCLESDTWHNFKLGYLIITDIIIMTISWIYFCLIKRDLKVARQSLIGRQDQLTSVSLNEETLKNKVSTYNKEIRNSNYKILTQPYSDPALSKYPVLSNKDEEIIDISSYNEAIKACNASYASDPFVLMRLKLLLTDDDYKNNLFLDYSLIKTDIKDNELYNLIGFSTAIYIALIIISILVIG